MAFACGRRCVGDHTIDPLVGEQELRRLWRDVVVKNLDAVLGPFPRQNLKYQASRLTCSSRWTRDQRVSSDKCGRRDERRNPDRRVCRVPAKNHPEGFEAQVGGARHTRDISRADGSRELVQMLQQEERTSQLPSRKAHWHTEFVNFQGDDLLRVCIQAFCRTRDEGQALIECQGHGGAVATLCQLGVCVKIHGRRP